MANKNAQDQSTAEISRQAARLFLQLKDQQRLSLHEGWRSVLWLMRSPRHVHELLLIRRHDAELTRVLRSCRPSSKVERSSSNIVHVNWGPGAPAKVESAKPRGSRVRWSIAAMVLLTVPTLGFFSGRDEGPPTGQGDSSDDSLGIIAKQPRTRRLPDGSFVSLDAGSMLQVKFTNARRDVHLQGGGLFDVVLDENRPFIVNTYLVDIASEAASAFAVKMDTSVEVAVYRGMVEVSGHGAKAGTPVIRVKSGETYRVPLDMFRTIVAAD
jgi:ferric-dicitrate binding protein FerR (iron transport regulator)